MHNVSTFQEESYLKQMQEPQRDDMRMNKVHKVFLRAHRLKYLL